MLDAKSRDNVRLIAAFVEREFGATLSLSLVVRLALRHYVGDLAQTLAERGDLAQALAKHGVHAAAIKAASEGR